MSAVSLSIPSAIRREQNAILAAEKGARSIVKDIAISSLKELATIALFTGVSLFFVTELSGMVLLTAVAVSIFAINTILRVAAALFQNQACKALQNGKIRKGAHLNDGAEYLKRLPALPFSILDMTTRNVLVHEMGHSAAALLLFKDSQPTITIDPLNGGATSFYVDKLTFFGKLIGRKASEIVVTAAGPAAAIACAMGMLSIAKDLKEDQGVAKMYLIVSAVSSIVQHILYALTAFWTPASFVSHDFRCLWNYGIHPLISMFAMAVLPYSTYFSSTPKKPESSA